MSYTGMFHIMPFSGSLQCLKLAVKPDKIAHLVAHTAHCLAQYPQVGVCVRGRRRVWGSIYHY